ncbi:cytochrome b/b6 domain-containing protein [Bdellovibrio sp. SKB1291214]|uniref:cytochrome b/b6 domain-containing protein n=1 Tax=Bdellovibrio sp. SKB1291214 TaxID=1732569 RepID=UPI00224041ED|nr:cytochrome b/b6 domain-containing protein [Bdellovibrio sp. SKB1291214]UYL07348.1 cytochrome b/b6 domain-containing protein [Bdellovibrio sp. SKB1291214]
MKTEIQKKHLLITRWNHWVNFPVIAIMVWSGFLIYWAYPAYFIPGSWLDRLGMGYQLARGMSWHFAFGILFVINGVLYVSYSIYSGHWRYRTYHQPQRIAYHLVITLAAVAVLSGFAIYKPIQLKELTFILGGYQWARLIHFVIAVIFVLFFIVHVVQVIRAGWNNFRAMVTGWEQVNRKDDE